jgi:flagellar motor switch protein FliM
VNPPRENSVEEVVVPVSQPDRQKARKPRTVYSCNFRSAGRLSNEDARALTVIHEEFGQHVSSALDAYLGASFEVKLEALDQLSIKDHIAGLPAHCYVVPFSANSMFMEFDNELVFPIIELLLGGSGAAEDPGRELSEIEDEIMQDIVLLIGRQAVAAWQMPDLAFVAGHRIKASEMHQAFAINEIATVFRFGVQLAGVAGSFRLIFSAEFLNAVLKQIRLDQPQRRSRVWSFPMPPLRERILDCDVEVTAELKELRVPVRDLIALQPGSVLKLHAPIRIPAMLTAGGHGLFEAAPVRIGSQRAAQLGRTVRPADRERR